jgi:NADH dehydrogenase
VADVRGLRFSGTLAWLLWLFVHILFLIGFRNRVAVVLQWAFSYVTFRRGARLITDTAEEWRAIAALRTPAPRQSPERARPPGSGPDGPLL